MKRASEALNYDHLIINIRPQHPEFDFEIPSNDIAILTFSEAFKSSKTIAPIDLNEDKTRTFAGESCEISGWGNSLKFFFTNNLFSSKNMYFFVQKLYIFSNFFKK